jgi:hypothetical protein
VFELNKGIVQDALCVIVHSFIIIIEAMQLEKFNGSQCLCFSSVAWWIEDTSNISDISSIHSDKSVWDDDDAAEPLTLAELGNAPSLLG